VVEVHGKFTFAIFAKLVTAGLGKFENIFQNSGGAEFGEPLLQKLCPYRSVSFDHELCLVTLFLKLCVMEYYIHAFE
jgi:hypothetical protein